MIKMTEGFEGYDPRSLDLEELIQLVTSNLNLLSGRFKELESDGCDFDKCLTPEEYWAFDDLNDVIVSFCKHYCWY